MLRIEPLEGKNAIVLKYKDNEVYYDMTSGLKVKEVKRTIGIPSKIAANDVFFLLNSEATTITRTAIIIFIR